MEKKIPLRQCKGCRKRKEKSELFRLVKSPDGSVLFDPEGKMNLRGVYVCRSLKCIETAMKKKTIDRELKVFVPAYVYENLKKEL